MKIDFEYTDAKFGGFGTLGRGIANGLTNILGHTITQDNPDVCIGYGTPNVLDHIRERHPDKPLIFYTVWESSEYPSDWVKNIENCKVDLVLTPAEFTKQSLIEAGVDKSIIKIWHHGIDTRWEYKERRDDDVFTFLHYNAYEWRKGWDIVLGAFLAEFGPEDKVKLILKARERDYANWIVPGGLDLDKPLELPKVKELLGYLTNEQMTEMCESADCGVFPVHGEGWFMPATECVMQGIPVIMPKQMAMAEQWNPGCIDLELDGYVNAHPRYPGWMIQPSLEDLRKKMRWCYNNEEKCREMGKKGSKDVLARFNWNKIMGDLEQYLSLVCR